ncbi:AMP-binding protein [Kitasatospora sp. NBC_00240]|uniref:AMP-binding protein n=1 Tax=Kitasatospora sp. NBC_00240 TaxID=2903567 RepID=UPI002256009C|nr:AMP-binding protein [Kitasatospora sp. NBC_00240]MCX5214804.1 AMP-binding protein [Kitasatospora sp. NBC_00240]
MGLGEGSAGATGVHHLFEAHARRAPDAVAVRCGDQWLTYGELDARANRLSHHLRASGLAPGGLAAVSTGRGPDILVAILAVLKAGAAYLPLEPSSPDPLLRRILTEAAPAVLVTHESHRVRLADATAGAVVCLDSAAGAIDTCPAEPLPPVAGAGLACVVFTSGSTGESKGAMIEHRSLIAACRAWQQVYGLSPADRILQSATLEFDVFTGDWVRALCSGATLVMARRNFTLDRTAGIAELAALALAEGVTVLELNLHNARRLHAHLGSTPGSPGLPGVRLLTVGADKWYLDEQLALQALLGPEVRLLNVYGTAEACVDSAYFDARGLDPAGPDAGDLHTRGTDDAGGAPRRRSLIGVPFPGTRLYVLGPDGRPLPPGHGPVPGEIAVGGPGVGPGYLGRPGPTAERFRTVDFDPDGRIHLTGDLGRLRPDGLLEFVGRADGFADPARAAAAAEAEAVLGGHPGVAQCVVAEVETAPGRRALVAYVVASDEGADSWTLSAYLRERLPVAQLPAAVVLLPSLPRTRAGKPDRRALPLPAPADHAAGPLLPGPRSVKGGRSAKGAGGKAGGRPGSGELPSPGGQWLAGSCLALAVGLIATLATFVLFPGSTDVSGIPSPWSGLLRLLHFFECLSFGAGVVVLLGGRPAVRRLGRPRALTTAAHLSLVWLLASWWPQDNLYRTSRATDWPRQVALVYTFNVTLMLAALVLVRFVTWRAWPARHPKG